MGKTAGVLIALLLALPADAGPRDLRVKREFQRLNPCPSTGRPAGPCPGFQADHIVPLCMGGPDMAGNLQWLATHDHRAKTRTDVANCRMSKNFTVWY